MLESQGILINSILCLVATLQSLGTYQNPLESFQVIMSLSGHFQTFEENVGDIACYDNSIE